MNADSLSSYSTVTSDHFSFQADGATVDSVTGHKYMRTVYEEAAKKAGLDGKACLMFS